MSNIKQVIEGWRNHLIPPEELKELINTVSKERLSICLSCPKQSENAKSLGHKTIRTDLHCTLCGCPLITKTKSLSSKCPANPPLWEAIATDTERFEIERQIKESNESIKLQTGDNTDTKGIN